MPLWVPRDEIRADLEDQAKKRLEEIARAAQQRRTQIVGDAQNAIAQTGIDDVMGRFNSLIDPLISKGREGIDTLWNNSPDTPSAISDEARRLVEEAQRGPGGQTSSQTAAPLPGLPPSPLGGPPEPPGLTPEPPAAPPMPMPQPPQLPGFRPPGVDGLAEKAGMVGGSLSQGLGNLGESLGGLGSSIGGALDRGAQARDSGALGAGLGQAGLDLNQGAQGLAGTIGDKVTEGRDQAMELANKSLDVAQQAMGNAGERFQQTPAAALGRNIGGIAGGVGDYLTQSPEELERSMTTPRFAPPGVDGAAPRRDPFAGITDSLAGFREQQAAGKPEADRQYEAWESYQGKEREGTGLPGLLQGAGYGWEKARRMGEEQFRTAAGFGTSGEGLKEQGQALFGGAMGPYGVLPEIARGGVEEMTGSPLAGSVAYGAASILGPGGIRDFLREGVPVVSRMLTNPRLVPEMLANDPRGTLKAAALGAGLIGAPVAGIKTGIDALREGATPQEAAAIALTNAADILQISEAAGIPIEAGAKVWGALPKLGVPKLPTPSLPVRPGEAPEALTPEGEAGLEAERPLEGAEGVVGLDGATPRPRATRMPSAGGEVVPGLDLALARGEGPSAAQTFQAEGDAARRAAREVEQREAASYARPVPPQAPGQEAVFGAQHPAVGEYGSYRVPEGIPDLDEKLGATVASGRPLPDNEWRGLVNEVLSQGTSEEKAAATSFTPRNTSDQPPPASVFDPSYNGVVKVERRPGGGVVATLPSGLQRITDAKGEVVRADVRRAASFEDYLSGILADYREFRDPETGYKLSDFYPEFGAGIDRIAFGAGRTPEQGQAAQNEIRSGWAATTANTPPVHNLRKALHLSALSHEFLRVREEMGLPRRLPTGDELQLMLRNGKMYLFPKDAGAGVRAADPAGRSAITLDDELPGMEGDSAAGRNATPTIRSFDGLTVKSGPQTNWLVRLPEGTRIDWIRKDPTAAQVEAGEPGNILAPERVLGPDGQPLRVVEAYNPRDADAQPVRVAVNFDKATGNKPTNMGYQVMWEPEAGAGAVEIASNPDWVVRSPDPKSHATMGMGGSWAKAEVNSVADALAEGGLQIGSAPKATTFQGTTARAPKNEFMPWTVNDKVNFGLYGFTREEAAGSPAAHRILTAHQRALAERNGLVPDAMQSLLWYPARFEIGNASYGTKALPERVEIPGRDGGQGQVLEPGTPVPEGGWAEAEGYNRHAIDLFQRAVREPISGSVAYWDAKKGGWTLPPEGGPSPVDTRRMEVTHQGKGLPGEYQAPAVRDTPEAASVGGPYTPGRTDFTERTLSYAEQSASAVANRFQVETPDTAADLAALGYDPTTGRIKTLSDWSQRVYHDVQPAPDGSGFTVTLRTTDDGVARNAASRVGMKLGLPEVTYFRQDADGTEHVLGLVKNAGGTWAPEEMRRAQETSGLKLRVSQDGTTLYKLLDAQADAPGIAILHQEIDSGRLDTSRPEAYPVAVGRINSSEYADASRGPGVGVGAFGEPVAPERSGLAGGRTGFVGVDTLKKASKTPGAVFDVARGDEPPQPYSTAEPAAPVAVPGPTDLPYTGGKKLTPASTRDVNNALSQELQRAQPIGDTGVRALNEFGAVPQDVADGVFAQPHTAEIATTLQGTYNRIRDGLSRAFPDAGHADTEFGGLSVAGDYNGAIYDGERLLGPGARKQVANDPYATLRYAREAARGMGISGAADLGRFYARTLVETLLHEASHVDVWGHKKGSDFADALNRNADALGPDLDAMVEDLASTLGADGGRLMGALAGDADVLGNARQSNPDLAATATGLVGQSAGRTRRLAAAARADAQRGPEPGADVLPGGEEPAPGLGGSADLGRGEPGGAVGAPGEAQPPPSARVSPAPGEPATWELENEARLAASYSGQEGRLGPLEGQAPDDYSTLTPENRALHQHPVRERGLETANDASAHNYLERLRALTVQRMPDDVAEADGALGAYEAGDYSTATRISENLLMRLHRQELEGQGAPPAGYGRQRRVPPGQRFGPATPAIPETPAASYSRPGEPAFDPEMVAKANRSARGAGAIGKNAVVPRYVVEHINPRAAGRVLDFGSGDEAKHTMSLRALGYDVTAHEFGVNQVEGTHDPEALTRQYDTVYAANVVNTQGSYQMLDDTVGQIAKATTDDGQAIVNYASGPWYFKRADGKDPRPKEVLAALEKQFGNVERVGGTAGRPIWRATEPIRSEAVPVPEEPAASYSRPGGYGEPPAEWGVPEHNRRGRDLGLGNMDTRADMDRIEASMPPEGWDGEQLNEIARFGARLGAKEAMEKAKEGGITPEQRAQQTEAEMPRRQVRAAEGSPSVGETVAEEMGMTGQPGRQPEGETPGATPEARAKHHTRRVQEAQGPSEVEDALTDAEDAAARGEIQQSDADDARGIAARKLQRAQGRDDPLGPTELDEATATSRQRRGLSKAEPPPPVEGDQNATPVGRRAASKTPKERQDKRTAIDKLVDSAERATAERAKAEGSAEKQPVLFPNLDARPIEPPRPGVEGEAAEVRPDITQPQRGAPSRVPLPGMEGMVTKLQSIAQDLEARAQREAPSARIPEIEGTAERLPVVAQPTLGPAEPVARVAGEPLAPGEYRTELPGITARERGAPSTLAAGSTPAEVADRLAREALRQDEAAAAAAQRNLAEMGPAQTREPTGPQLPLREVTGEAEGAEGLGGFVPPELGATPAGALPGLRDLGDRNILVGPNGEIMSRARAQANILGRVAKPGGWTEVRDEMLGGASDGVKMFLALGKQVPTSADDLRRVQDEAARMFGFKQPDWDRLMQGEKRFRPGHVLDMLGAYSRINLIFNPESWARNMLSTSVGLPYRLSEAAFSPVFNRAWQGIGGRDAKNTYIGESVAMLEGLARSISAATANSMHTMRFGNEAAKAQMDVSAKDAASFYDTRLGKATEGFFRPLTAGDVFFKTLNEGMESFRLAYRQASDEAGSGVWGANPLHAKIRSRMWEVASTATPKFLDQVQQAGEYNTFNTKAGEWVKRLEALKNYEGTGGPAVRLLANLMVPFVRIPVNVAKWGWERTPVGGIANTLIGGARTKMVRDEKTGKMVRRFSTDTAEMGDRTARAFQGVLLAGTLYAAEQAGLAEITGASPDDPDEKDEWRLQGKTPYSIRLGDRWFDPSNIPGLGQTVLQAGIMKDAVREWQDTDEEESEGLFSRLAGTIGKGAEAYIGQEQIRPMFGSVAHALVAYNPAFPQQTREFSKRELQRSLASEITPFSGLGRAIGGQLDPTERDAKTFSEQVALLNPLTRENVTPRYDALGNEVQSERYRWAPAGITASREATDATLPRVYRGSTSAAMDREITRAVTAVQGYERDRRSYRPPTARERMLARRYGSRKNPVRERLNKRADQAQRIRELTRSDEGLFQFRAPTRVRELLGA